MPVVTPEFEISQPPDLPPTPNWANCSVTVKDAGGVGSWLRALSSVVNGQKGHRAASDHRYVLGALIEKCSRRRLSADRRSIVRVDLVGKPRDKAIVGEVGNLDTAEDVSTGIKRINRCNDAVLIRGGIVTCAEGGILKGVNGRSNAVAGVVNVGSGVSRLVVTLMGKLSTTAAEADHVVTAAEMATAMRKSAWAEEDRECFIGSTSSTQFTLCSFQYQDGRRIATKNSEKSWGACG